MMKLHMTGTHGQILHMDDRYICPLCEEETEQKFMTFEEIKVRLMVTILLCIDGIKI